MTLELTAIFDTVQRGWQFDTKTYPRLDLGIQKRVASTSHVLLHISKTAGRLATVFEQLAHMEQKQGSDSAILAHPVTKEGTARQIAYMIVNVVKLAQLADISPAEIAAEIQKWQVEQERDLV